MIYDRKGLVFYSCVPRGWKKEGRECLNTVHIEIL